MYYYITNTVHCIDLDLDLDLDHQLSLIGSDLESLPFVAKLEMK